MIKLSHAASLAEPSSLCSAEWVVILQGLQGQLRETPLSAFPGPVPCSQAKINNEQAEGSKLVHALEGPAEV